MNMNNSALKKGETLIDTNDFECNASRFNCYKTSRFWCTNLLAKVNCAG